MLGVVLERVAGGVAEGGGGFAVGERALVVGGGRAVVDVHSSHYPLTTSTVCVTF